MAFPDFLTYLKRDERWSGIPSGLIHIAQIDHIHWRRSLIDHAIAKAFGQEGGNTIKGLEVELIPGCAASASGFRIKVGILPVSACLRRPRGPP